MLRRLARFSIHHRRLIAAAWVILFVAGIAIGTGVFDRLDPDVGDVEGTESARADARLRALDPGGESIAALADGVDPRDPQVAAGIRATAGRLRAIPGVNQVADPFSGPPGLLARDGRAALVAVEFEHGLGEDRFDRALEAAETELRRLDAPHVLVGGGPLQDREFEDQVASDLGRAELLSMPVVLVLLLVVFGGIVAAGLPVLVALVGVAGTLLALFGISSATDVSVYSVNVVTMLGLGLAVDYALLLVSRFREERATHDVPTAIEETAASAGRTVVFSGLTVAASLAGLLVFQDPFLRSMAYGGGAVVLIDLLAAITLLPVLLTTCGHHIRSHAPHVQPPAHPAPADPAADATPARRERLTRTRRHGIPRWGRLAQPGRDGAALSTTLSGEGTGPFASISRVVQRRAVLIVVLVAVPLVVAATPFLHAHYEQPDARFLPAGAESRELFETLKARFDPAVWVEPVTVVADAGADRTGLAAFTGRIAGLDGVRGIGERRSLAGGVHVIEVVPEGTGTDVAASRLVEDVRALRAPFPFQVTGDAADLTDYQATIADRLPLAAALVALATFVLLFLFTGSVVVPVKAIVMNILSLGASFGALVWVFQEGHLAWLLGAEGTGALDPTVPVLTFAITFGLSMDYEVFLLSRIKEAWDETGDNDRAVALGLQRTGRIVTSAALLLVVVFAGFMAAGMLTIKQIGLGTVLAVALDATVVRMLLVPATMKLMGRWNWWAPAPLRRLHRRIGLEERAAAARPGAQALSRWPAVPGGEGVGGGHQVGGGAGEHHPAQCPAPGPRSISQSAWAITAQAAPGRRGTGGKRPQQPGRALDVGEQQRYRSGRQLDNHHPISLLTEARLSPGPATWRPTMPDHAGQAAKARRFLELHVPGRPLLLPNPWDQGSARLLAWLGFEALATTSSGFAATLGRLDGSVTREDAVAHAATIVAATELPVSADLENGFADDPAGVADTIALALGAGLAGCSVEDFTGRPDDPIYETGLAAERVRAAAEAAHRGPVHLVLTARAENHLHGRPDLADTIARLQAYQEAGADVLYAPGLRRLEDIGLLVASVDRPVNVLAVAGAPPVGELATAGVGRVSVGGAFAFAALGAVVEAATELREAGTYGFWQHASTGRDAAGSAFGVSATEG